MTARPLTPGQRPMPESEGPEPHMPEPAAPGDRDTDATATAPTDADVVLSGDVHWLVSADADPAAQTPVMRQVLDAKSRHPDCIVFFRLGDFYELFFEDALVAAPLLDMVLTSRNKRDPRPIPMCGFPHFAMEQHVERLIGLGRRIAIVEQLEDPRLVKGIVKRGVTRVITPGVVLEPEALDGKRGNHIVAIVAGQGAGFGVALADVSTGALRLGAVAHAVGLDTLLVRAEAREVLVAAGLQPRLDAVPALAQTVVTIREPEPRDVGRLRSDPPALAVALLRSYLAEVRPGVLGLLGAAMPLDEVPHLRLERETVQHLELLRTARTGALQGALLGAIDRTVTAAGARVLRGLLLAPLADASALELRHDAVQALLAAAPQRRALRAALANAADLERIAGRVCAGMVTPRELARARDTLLGLPTLLQQLHGLPTLPAALAACVDAFARGAPLAAELQRTLHDEPRNALADGDVIRPGRCAELDEAVAWTRDADAWAEAYQEQLRVALGIPGLKIRHNRLTGWGIEISRSRGDQVPATLRRVQTLKHVERYTTPELSDFEARVQSAEADRLARETALWNELCAWLRDRAADLRAIGAALGELDLHLGFAEIADERGHVRPRFDPDGKLTLVACRHPVVEQMLPRGAFVANDVSLDPATMRVLLLTGPNMAGKSTLMRQVALASIVAQAGGFVAADEAQLPLLDAVMTRIGAADDIAAGASTFMVEMRETSAILARATPRSLVLLDEVGRGTSTDDGLAIAQAIVEHLHDRTGALVLFATHYHELTALASALPCLVNAHVAVREVGDDVVFVHTLQPGPTNRSHGLAVARLAGLPDDVIRRARVVLEGLHRSAPRPSAPVRQLGLFDSALPRPDPDAAARTALVASLRALDVDDLSPRQAHALLEGLVARARSIAPAAIEPAATGAGHEPSPS